MPRITFLGPVGATFSHDAYNLLAKEFDGPQAIMEGSDANCEPASSNEEILGMIARHGGYGAIAMETLAGGRVDEPIESFIDLLRSFDAGNVPFHVIGAIGLKLHFCLMAREGVSLNSIDKVIAHPKALGACKKRLERSGMRAWEAKSNGEAARLVAESDEHAVFAALGPASAAEKYGLRILDRAYEDARAVTTFFLLGPKQHERAIGERNRALIVFEVAHRPASLVRALQAFEALNMIHIHSVHAGSSVYHFAIELEVNREEIAAFELAMREFESRVERHLCFGPFEVLSR